MKITKFISWDFLERSVRAWPLDYYRTIHSIKTAVACLLGLSLVEYFHWPMGQWVPITIIVVMSAQTNFGAALQKAYMRFLGTVAGVSIAIFTLLVLGNSLLAILIITFLSCLFFTYIASSGKATSYAGTLGGVTVVLTLTTSSATIQQAIIRGLYIIIGIIIALLVSRFIFPIHAREKLRITAAKTLRDLCRLYAKTIQLTPQHDQSSSTKEDKIDKNIIENLTLQTQLIKEAAAGSHYFSSYKKNLCTEFVNGERKIYRLIYFMRKSIHESSDMQKTMHNISAIENIHIIVENSLDSIAENMEKFTPPSIITNFTALLDNIDTITDSLPKETNVHKLLTEHSFLFLLEQIIKEVKMLYNLSQKINDKNHQNHGLLQPNINDN